MYFTTIWIGGGKSIKDRAKSKLESIKSSIKLPQLMPSPIGM
jgi:hypothetical protein